MNSPILIKYIYFEIQTITGANNTGPVVQNENVLGICPRTNSDGMWAFKNFNERRGFSEKSFCIVDQYWIDLEKHKNRTMDYQINGIGSLDKVIENVLITINEKLVGVKDD